MKPVPSQTRLHSVAFKIAREAAAAGYTSLTVNVRPVPGQKDDYGGFIDLVMPAPGTLPITRPTPGLIRTDRVPDMLQAIGPEQEATFRHVLEVILDQGYTDISITSSTELASIWNGVAPRRTAVLMLHRKGNYLSGIADVARKWDISVDELMTREGLPQECRPIGPEETPEQVAAGYISALDRMAPNEAATDEETA